MNGCLKAGMIRFANRMNAFDRYLLIFDNRAKKVVFERYE